VLNDTVNTNAHGTTATALSSGAAKDVDEMKVDASQLIIEHRMFVAIIPLRVYLDGNFISFVKDLVPAPTPTVGIDCNSNSTATTSPSVTGQPPNSNESGDVQPNAFYLQYVQLSSIDIKIDYLPSAVNFAALKQGDFLQVCILYLIYVQCVVFVCNLYLICV
jgi:hypothetical protein